MHARVHQVTCPHACSTVRACISLSSDPAGEYCGVQEVAHRRPYEVLMLLQPLGTSPHQLLSPAASTATNKASAVKPADLSIHTNGEGAQPAFHATPPPPDGLVMVAVPGEHSRKPQLAQLLQPYLLAKASCLEVCDQVAVSRRAKFDSNLPEECNSN